MFLLSIIHTTVCHLLPVLRMYLTKCPGGRTFTLDQWPVAVLGKKYLGGLAPHHLEGNNG